METTRETQPAVTPERLLAVIRDVLADQSMTVAQRLVTIAVVGQVNWKTGEAWASYRQLMALLGIRSSTISNVLSGDRGLAVGRYLDVAGYGRQRAVCYRLSVGCEMPVTSCASAPAAEALSAPAAEALDPEALQQRKRSSSGSAPAAEALEPTKRVGATEKALQQRKRSSSGSHTNPPPLKGGGELGEEERAMLYTIACQFHTAKHEPKQFTVDQALEKFAAAIGRGVFTEAELAAWVEAHPSHDLRDYDAVKEVAAKAKRDRKDKQRAGASANVEAERAAALAERERLDREISEQAEVNRRAAQLLDGLSDAELADLKDQAIETACSDFEGRAFSRANPRTSFGLRRVLVGIIDRRAAAGAVREEVA